MYFDGVACVVCLPQKASTQQEYLSPILMTLVKCVRCNTIQRRYIRTVVLPPLRDVSERPEVGTELRNHLCRLLTTPATQVRDLSAEFLFILCKENGNDNTFTIYNLNN